MFDAPIQLELIYIIVQDQDGQNNNINLLLIINKFLLKFCPVSFLLFKSKTILVKTSENIETMNCRNSINES